MKLHIGVNIPYLSGYLNIDPIPGDNKIIGDFRNLDNFCNSSECTEILAYNVLDYVHGSDILSVIKNYASKLRHGGKLVLGGTELVEVAKKVITGEMHVHEVNVQIYGKEKTAWNVKQGCYSILDIVGILTELGLKVQSKRIMGNEFIITALRP